ncbi:hypothetical protein KSP39_PZI003871 [Platanthera zijinensis]|uniref:Uncharacterized protein n=1 Tax=Platanthera zijinensis TaxID=2320716 RepID=A0AAP0BWH6_9ASPA
MGARQPLLPPSLPPPAKKSEAPPPLPSPARAELLSAPHFPSRPPPAGPSSSRPLFPSPPRHGPSSTLFLDSARGKVSPTLFSSPPTTSPATSIAASSKARPKREIGHRHRRQARAKGNDVSTRAAGRSVGSLVGDRIGLIVIGTPSSARPQVDPLRRLPSSWQVDPLRRLPSSWQVRRLACGGYDWFDRHRHPELGSAPGRPAAQAPIKLAGPKARLWGKGRPAAQAPIKLAGPKARLWGKGRPAAQAPIKLAGLKARLWGKGWLLGYFVLIHFYDTPSRARPQVDPLRRLPSSWQVRRLACGGKVGF